jgi:hypothetical protein
MPCMPDEVRGWAENGLQNFQSFVLLLAIEDIHTYKSATTGILCQSLGFNTEGKLNFLQAALLWG